MSFRQTTWGKYLMAVWAALECALFGGLVYGWGSLVYVLKKEGIFADLCTNDSLNSSNITLSLDNVTSVEIISCPEQDEKLQLAFTLGTSLMLISSPFMGQIQYACGTRVARILSICFFLCGSLTIAFISTTTPWLLYISLPCLAIGGLPLIVTNIQVANLFVVGGSTVVGLLCGAFDASAAVQLLVKVAFENGISRQISYLFISALYTMVIFSTFVLLPKTFIPKVEVEATHSAVIVDDGDEMMKVRGENTRPATDSNELNRTDVKPRLIDCALSRIFLSHGVWFSLLYLRMLYFLGTLNPRLNYLTDNNEGLVSRYTNANLFIQLGSVLSSPLCGFVYDLESRRHNGKRSVTERRLHPAVVPLTLTSVLAILLSGLVLIQSTQVLYVDFVVLTVFRSFLFGTLSAYLQTVFPAAYFGFLYGVIMVTGGVVGCLQYPLFIWLEAPPRGPQKVNIFVLVLTLLSLIHPIHIWVTCRVAEKRRAAENSKTAEPDYGFIKKSVNIFVLVLTLLSLIHPIHIWITCRVAEKRRAAENSKTLGSDYGFIKKSVKYS